MPSSLVSAPPRLKTTSSGRSAAAQRGLSWSACTSWRVRRLPTAFLSLSARKVLGPSPGRRSSVTPVLCRVETSAEPSLQAKQLRLKRARLADDLNDKISHRPGPMELIHKNILPVYSTLRNTLLGTAPLLIRKGLTEGRMV